MGCSSEEYLGGKGDGGKASPLGSVTKEGKGCKGTMCFGRMSFFKAKHQLAGAQA